MKISVKFKKIKEFLVKIDFFRKFVSLFLAFCIWYYVNDKATGVVKFRIPLEISNLSADNIITQFDDKFITLVFEGDKEEISLLNKKLVIATVDLKKPFLNENFKYPVSITRTEIPENIEVYTEEKAVYIKVEKRGSREIKVNPVIEGSLENGYLMGNITVNPEKIKIGGPESMLIGIEKVETVPIQIDKKTSNINEKVKLKTFENNFIYFYKDNDAVDINIPIYEAKNVTRIDVPVKFKNWPKNISAVSENVSVQTYLRIKSVQSNNEGTDNISVIVDFNLIDKKLINSLAENESISVLYPVTISGIDDNNYSVLSTVPVNIKLTIKKEESK
ncbi:MAG: YbbR-like domain-containing protein [Spirochaetes bacterium]|nr:YbbR-like domain-containing protein [Spirochaetota bacterium]